MTGMVQYRIELIEAYEVPRRTFLARIANAAWHAAERAGVSVLRALRGTKPEGQLVAVVKFKNPPYRLAASAGEGGTADIPPLAKRGGKVRNKGRYDVKAVQKRLMAARIRAVNSRAYRTAIKLKEWDVAGKIITSALAVESDLIIGEQIHKEWGLPDNASGLPASVVLSAEAGLQMAGDTHDRMHSSEFISDVRDFAREKDVTSGNKEGQEALTGYVAVETHEAETGENIADTVRTGSEQGEDIWAEIQDVFDTMLEAGEAGEESMYYDREDGWWSPSDSTSDSTDSDRGTRGRNDGEEEEEENGQDDGDDEEDDPGGGDGEDEPDGNEEEDGEEEEEEEEPDDEEEDQNPEGDHAEYLAEFEMALDQLFGGGQRTRQQDRAIALAAGGGYTDPGDQGDEKTRRRLVRAVNLDGYRFLTLGEYAMWQLVQKGVDAGTGVHAGGSSLRPSIPLLTKIQLDAILLMISGGVTDPSETDDRTPPGRAPLDETTIPRLIIRPPKARFAVISRVTRK